MAWDSNRRVPWQRLFTEWAVVAAAIVLITLVFYDGQVQDTIGAIVLGGVIYVTFGAVMAKFGYARKSLKQIRAEAAVQQAQKAAAPTSAPATRSRPAPTKRTSQGPGSTKKKRSR